MTPTTTKEKDGLRANVPKPNKGGRPKCWFSDMYEFTHIPKKTAQRWWWEFQYFCNVLETPAQASDELRSQFTKWSLDRSESDKALKAADPLAYKAAMLARSLEVREALKPANKEARKAALRAEAYERWLESIREQLRANGPKPVTQEKGPVISDQPQAIHMKTTAPTTGHERSIA